MGITTDNVEEKRQKMLALEAALNGDLLERYKEVHTMVLALASRRHHFQIGPPGTAKSLGVSRLVLYIGGLGEQDYFHWLLTKHTLPDELFGPPNLEDMVERHKFKRSTAYKLPVAKIAFLDEIFKGNSAILNANLTIMNERKFFDDERPRQVDLACVFSASNELPSGDELNALFDRLHFRHDISPIKDTGNWLRMMDLDLDPNPDPVINWDEVLEIQEYIPTIEISDEANQAMKTLKEGLKDDGIFPTDRRWRDSRDIIRAEAFLNGRTTAIVEDLNPLAHVLWSNPNQIKTVNKAVMTLAAPLDRKANELLENVEELALEWRQQSTEHRDDSHVVTNVGLEINDKLVDCKNRWRKLHKKFTETGRNTEILKDIAQRVQTLTLAIAQGAFAIPVRDDEDDD